MSPRVDHGPTIEPTTASQVVVAALAGAAFTWLGLTTLRNAGGSLPLLGPAAWASVGLVALGVGVLAVRTHRTVQVRREPLEPQQGMTRLLLGKTSLLGGVLLAAVYATVVVMAVEGWPAPLAVDRVVHAAVASALSVAWAVAGWFLERACRIPPSDDDTPDVTDEEPDEPFSDSPLP